MPTPDAIQGLSRTVEPPVAHHERLAELNRCLDDLLNLNGAPQDACRDLKEKITFNAFNIVVVGQFKRGKTSVINALIGADMLPVGIVPLTSIVTVLRYGDLPGVTVLLHDGTKTTADPQDLVHYVTETGNPGNTKGVKQVLVSFPSSWLNDGVRLVDTPGIGSVYNHNTDAAYEYLPQADAIVFVVSADQPVSQAEIDFLKETTAYAGKIFCLLNKADYLSQRELQEATAFSKEAINTALGRAVPLFPVSARLALEGALTGSREKIERSLFPPFVQAVRRFLSMEKNEVLFQSVARHAWRLISHARLVTNLELKSLTSPLEELNAKIEAFEAKKRQVLQSKSDHDILLQGEATRLLKDTVEEELAVFTGQLAQRVRAKAGNYFTAHKGLPLRALYAELERQIISETRSAFDEWRMAEDRKVAAAFEALCTRFSSRMQETVDELYRYSSELFAIPIDSVNAGSLWKLESGFYYKFWSEPTSLHMLASTLVFALPKFIGERLLLRKISAYGVELIDRQSGRVRSDFAERLAKSVGEFRRDMLGQIEATVSGIDAAIRNGIKERSGGESTIQQRLEMLQDALTRLEKVKRRIGEILDTFTARHESHPAESPGSSVE